jgi:hypothetical protein
MRSSRGNSAAAFPLLQGKKQQKSSDQGIIRGSFNGANASPIAFPRVVPLNRYACLLNSLLVLFLLFLQK